jgi:hypothetical protein
MPAFLLQFYTRRCDTLATGKQNMERRDVFKIIATGAASAGLAASQHHTQSPFSAASYRPRFFAPADYEMIDRLADIIIPTDAQSPGAHEAGVRFYIDTLLHYSEPELQQRWRIGLDSVKEAARTKWQEEFANCTRPQQEQVVALLAVNEGNPTTDAERFFVALKRMTIDGYHLSETGMRRYLGYKGNIAISEFPGCTHDTHKRS